MILTLSVLQFYIGRELNSSIGSLDLKSFNELRPGLMFWVVIDIAMACTQAVRLGGRVTDSMWLVLLFQGWYVTDSFINEVSKHRMLHKNVYQQCLVMDSLRCSVPWISRRTASGSCCLSQ